MSPDSDDPYRSPASAEPSREETGIRYWHGYTWWLESPNWQSNLGCVALCALIPYVGLIVVMGYQFEIVNSLIRDPRRMYPDFDFNRFMDYLKRGLWPFLVLMIVGVAIMPLIGAMFVIAVALGIVLTDQNVEENMVLLFVLFYAMIFPLLSVVNVVRYPPFLRAGIQGSFTKVFEFSFCRDFFGRVLWPAICIELFLMVTSLPLVMAGLSCCVIGVYAAIAVLCMAQANHWYQLYWLYLQRGGSPIELAADVPPVAGGGQADGG